MVCVSFELTFPRLTLLYLRNIFTINGVYVGSKFLKKYGTFSYPRSIFPLLIPIAAAAHSVFPSLMTKDITTYVFCLLLLFWTWFLVIDSVKARNYSIHKA